jgi:pimeloyl-ACP methyl ester carboxylesterase
MPRPRPSWRPRRLSLAGGLQIAVFETGRADAAAPALLLVHGMGHDSQAAWDDVAAAFEATHRVVAFDLPGFGASDKPRAAYTLPFFGGVLDAVVRDAGLQNFALAGHSLGGLIAADYAARRPETLRTLVLIAPAGFLRTPVLALRIMGSGPVLGVLRSIKPSRAFVANTLDRAVEDPAAIDPADRDRLLERALDPAVARSFLAVYAGAMNEMVHMKALHARFAAWTKPTLLVWGERDRFIPVRALGTARAVYPQADVLRIERCGHCPSVEYADLVVGRMRAAGV